MLWQCEFIHLTSKEFHVFCSVSKARISQWFSLSNVILITINYIKLNNYLIRERGFVIASCPLLSVSPLKGLINGFTGLITSITGSKNWDSVGGNFQLPPPPFSSAKAILNSDWLITTSGMDHNFDSQLSRSNVD